jgi:DNA-binding transcriptional MerR regulator
MSLPPDTDIPQGHGLFPIRHVCAETGINPVTLRAWERRYGLIRPVRTPKGHRLYSALDIERIRRILAFLEEGVAVSQVGRVLERDPGRGVGQAATRDSISDVPPRSVTEPAGGVPPYVPDPVAASLLGASESLTTVQLERTYARLVMRHGWEGVHETAFLEAYSALCEKARHDPAGEARLAVFASWAASTFAEQLRSALLLCEGPTCPALIEGHGHRRLEGLLFLLATARQGLRILPLPDTISPPAMEQLSSHLDAPAIVLHVRAPSPSAGDSGRIRTLLMAPGVPAFLVGPGTHGWAALQSPRALIPLTLAPLQAADALTRQVLEQI